MTVLDFCEDRSSTHEHSSPGQIMMRGRLIVAGTVVIACALGMAAVFISLTGPKRVAARLTELSFAEADLVIEKRSWPGLGNNGYTLLGFQFPKSAEAKLRAYCAKHHSLGNGTVYWTSLPGLEGETVLNDAFCVARVEGTIVAVLADLRVLISVTDLAR